MKNSTVAKLTCVGLTIGSIGFGVTGFTAGIMAIIITFTGCTGVICSSIEERKS